jgi:hypothetical protein
MKRNKPSRHGYPLLEFFVVMIAVSCTTIGSLTTKNTLEQNPPTTNEEINNILPTDTNILYITETTPNDSCLIDNPLFCQFLSKIKPLFMDDNIEEILDYVKYYKCDEEHFEQCYGIVNVDCILTGVLGSEGGCAARWEIIDLWNAHAKPPIDLVGIVYPSLPVADGIGKEGFGCV